MTNLEQLKEFKEKMETLSYEEMAEYVQGNYNYAVEPGNSPEETCNVYNITDEYSLWVGLSYEDMLKASAYINKITYDKDIDDYDIEELSGIYQKDEFEIDLQLLTWYLEENEKEILEDTNEGIERLEDED